jgi:GR25 family glycosyltransferase involved in LPS biosynthesis
VKLPVDAIYFISLQKSSGRRKHLLKMFETLGIQDMHGNPPQWHLASDGNKPPHVVDNSKKPGYRRQRLSMGEIGCCASHRAVWTKIVQIGHSLTLVLEDDAEFLKEETINLINNWDKLPDFDFLHLGWQYYAGYKEQTIEKVDIPELPNLWKGDGMWLTHAYIITNDLASDWLKRTQKQYNGLDAMTADFQLDCRAYGFKPPICRQNQSRNPIFRGTILHTS